MPLERGMSVTLVCELVSQKTFMGLRYPYKRCELQSHVHKAEPINYRHTDFKDAELWEGLSYGKLRPKADNE